MVTKKTKLNEDTVIRNMLNCIRNKEQKTLLKEVFNNEEKLFEPSQNKKIFHHNKNQNLPRTEVFVTNEHNSRQNSRSNCHNHHKRGDYTTQNEIKEQNVEKKRNIAHAESKIRVQIINDKMIHKAKKEK